MKNKLSKNTRALIYGYVFGVLDAFIMIQLELPNKTLAILGATVNRFSIGYFIPITEIQVPLWMRGMMIGFLLSLPDAIVTSAYVLVLGIGILGGTVIGIIERNSRISSRNA